MSGRAQGNIVEQVLLLKVSTSHTNDEYAILHSIDPILAGLRHIFLTCIC